MASHESLAPEINARLASFDEDYPNYRGRELAELHSQIYSQFIIADGFGEIRMGGFVTPRSIELPELVIVPQPMPRDPDCCDDDATRPTEPSLISEWQLSNELLLVTHDSAYLDFLDPRRMGYAESRERVSGFVPHQFSQVPAVEHAEWQVSRIELISLLKHEEPVAYVSEHLPSMEELGDAPIRPLNQFERYALELLPTDSDLEIAYDTNRINMVGSVRAAENCTECHAVPYGKLLGAFSYRLDRTTPVRLVESGNDN